MKLRILISGHLPPPMGGMAAYYQTLINSSLGRKVDLRFVQTSSQKRELSSSGRATISNLVSAVRDCARFTKAILTYRPQISHIGSADGLSFIKHSYCVFIAHILGSRVLLHPHCSLAALYSGRSKWWHRLFIRVIRWSNGVLVLSKEWLQLRDIVPGCRVYYLPNAIDISLFREIAELRLARREVDDKSKILYLGYLGKAKGSFDLLEAASILRAQEINLVFDLVGTELTFGELEQLRTKIHQAGLEDYVRLHLPAYGSEKLDFFRNADIFVYPSHAEGLPIAVLGAMACGLPIVATRVGGLPDLVEHGINGFLVEPKQPALMADALCSLSKNHELRYSMQQINYQLACRKYDIEQHVEQLIGIYETLISSS